jgi:hypothetical protein
MKNSQTTALRLYDSLRRRYIRWHYVSLRSRTDPLHKGLESARCKMACKRYSKVSWSRSSIARSPYSEHFPPQKHPSSISTKIQKWEHIPIMWQRGFDAIHNPKSCTIATCFYNIMSPLIFRVCLATELC